MEYGEIFDEDEEEMWAASRPKYPHMLAPRDFSVLHLPLTPHKWRDADDRMFFACFTILGEFVEEELGRVEPAVPSSEAPDSPILETEDSGTDEGPDLHEREGPSHHRGYRLHCIGGTDEQAIDLWLWYRDELPALQKAYDDDIEESFSGEKVKFSEPDKDGLIEILDFGKVKEPKFEYNYPEKIKDQKLRQLIELRQTLWT